MDTNTLGQLSFRLLAAVLILREVFGFLKGANHNKPNKLLDDIDRKVDQLYEWHNKTDENGVKVWYSRNVVREISTLVESIQTQTMILKQMAEDTRSLYGEIRDRENN